MLVAAEKGVVCGKKALLRSCACRGGSVDDDLHSLRSDKGNIKCNVPHSLTHSY